MQIVPLITNPTSRFTRADINGDNVVDDEDLRHSLALLAKSLKR